MIPAIHSLITMAALSVETNSRIHNPVNIVSCWLMDYTNLNSDKVCYIEDKADFQKGNSTDHATIQATNEITRLWNKINPLLEFLLTSLKLLMSQTSKEVRKLRYEGK